MVNLISPPVMDRRAFPNTVELGLLAAPLVAETQPDGRVDRLGLVSIATDPARPRTVL